MPFSFLFLLSLILLFEARHFNCKNDVLTMKVASLRTKKGVIEVEFTVINEVINDMKITGDFFVYPEEALEDLEQALNGTLIDESSLEQKIAAIYKSKSLSTPGITINDWIEVILKAFNS